MARLTAAQVANIIKNEFRFNNSDGIDEFVTEKQLKKLIASLATTVEKLVDGVGVDAASTTEQIVQSRTTQISAADILALATTPIELLPALPAGQHYVLLPSILKQETFGSAYLANNGSNSAYALPVKQGTLSTSRELCQFNAYALFNGNITAVRSFDSDPYNWWAAPSLSNGAVYLWPITLGGTAATMTGGTGTTFSITMNYIISE